MKKPIASDKVVKYAKARAKGLTKNESKAVAGYSANTMPLTIESSEAYKSLSIKDSLLSHITRDEITQAHVDLIKQTDDRGVRLNAIKLSYERIEPVTNVLEDNDKVTVILKSE